MTLQLVQTLIRSSTPSSFILHCRYILRRVSSSLVNNIIPLGFRECGGGYVEVYRGKLSSGEAIAVNRLLKFVQMIVQMMKGRRSFDWLDNGTYENLPAMDWKIRYKIAIGTAKWLHLLYKGFQRRIIHRGIKASNILLTDDFEPQCGFLFEVSIMSDDFQDNKLLFAFG